MPPKFDPLVNPYPSIRHVQYARYGMAATSQPLAAQAGLEILKKGGNAVDAAIAVASCLTVVEPTSNGIGSDSFAIVWMKDKMYGLNSSGRSPKNISIDAVKGAGHEKMPVFGWTPVTVPGAPGAWAALSKRFGNLSFAETLAPAINYAENGYPVSPTLGRFWAKAYQLYKDNLSDCDFAQWTKVFAPNGRAPGIGEMWFCKEMADTLREIAETNSESFYRGRLADIISAESEKSGGYLAKSDLEAFEPDWVDPISVNYRGYDVWEIPPNGQGLVALMALNTLKGYDFHTKDDIETYHKQFEAMKLAFVTGKHHITDPDHMKVTPAELLSESFGDMLRGKISDTAAMPEPMTPQKGGTVYLATADKDGNMVSFIQSNYLGFGSGIVVPGTGISLQNRGHDFSLDPSHVNHLSGGKKTYHTIIPGFLTKGGKAVGPFGVMGAYMQPQGHVQVIMNSIDFHLNPQQALNSPRWQWISGKTFEVEPGFPRHIAEELVRRGHQVNIALDNGNFGRGQIIWRNQDGVLIGGCEPRTDSAIATW